MPTAEVARAFGLGTPQRELTHVARGAMGTVYRLDTDTGSYSVKSLFWGPAGDEDKNLALQFAALDAGVAMPRPRPTTEDAVVAQLDDGTSWRVYEWVEGSHYKDRPASPAIAASVARSLGRLHALRYDAGSVVDSWFTEPVGSERIETALDIAAAHGWNVGNRRDAMLAFDAVVSAAPDVPPIGCHHDADRSNALLSHEEVVFIDWDNAGAGVAEREFAEVLLHWAWGDGPDERTVHTMVDVYRSCGAPFATRDLAVFAPSFSAWLHYVLNCYEHLADPTVDADHLAYERSTLEQLEAHAPSLAPYERLLEMIPA